MSWKDLSPILREALDEMCRVVGSKPSSIDWDDQNWFLTRSWTAEQEETYVKWMTDWLVDNKEARESLLAHPRRNRSHCHKAAREFAWTYGWRRA